MIAILGLPSFAPGAGALGERIKFRRVCHIWYRKTNGWRIGFSMMNEVKEKQISFN